MTLSLRVLGVELVSLRLGRPPRPIMRAAAAADPSTHAAAASSPRLADTSLTADPIPLDGFGFGFATTGGTA